MAACRTMPISRTDGWPRRPCSTNGLTQGSRRDLRPAFAPRRRRNRDRVSCLLRASVERRPFADRDFGPQAHRPRLQSRGGGDRRRIAVPGAGADRTAAGDRGDPFLELDAVGVGETLPPVAFDVETVAAGFALRERTM